MGFVRRPRCALTTNAVVIWRGNPEHVAEEISLEHGLMTMNVNVCTKGMR